MEEEVVLYPAKVVVMYPNVTCHPVCIDHYVMGDLLVCPALDSYT